MSMDYVGEKKTWPCRKMERGGPERAQLDSLYVLILIRVGFAFDQRLEVFVGEP